VRIRSRAPGAGIRTTIGVVSALTPDRLYLDVAGDPRNLVGLDMRDVEQVETSIGRQRNFGRNFGLTVAFASLGVGLLMGATWTPCDDWLCLFTPETRAGAVALGLAGGAVLGVPVGIIVGFAAKSERWLPVVAPTASPGGPKLGLTWTVALSR